MINKRQWVNGHVVLYSLYIVYRSVLSTVVQCSMLKQINIQDSVLMRSCLYLKLAVQIDAELNCQLRG